MKQTVLKQPLQTARRQLRGKTALCIFAVVLTLALNLVLLLTVRVKTKRLFCLINIAADVLCFVLVIWFCTEKIAPLRRLCRLAGKPMTEATGTVTALSERTVRYMDMDCVELTVNDRKLFLPASSMALQVGETYCFRLVSGIVMEAEQ